VFEVSPGELPLSVLTHLYPSRYCQSDRLDRFAQRTFGSLPPGYQRVVEVCNWIHDNVDYVSGASDALTSAYDTVSQRAGVCRDFAHLGIVLCASSPPTFMASSERSCGGRQGWGGICSIRLAGPIHKASCGLVSGGTRPRWRSAVWRDGG
jgi:hypothetical protein